MTRSKPKRFFGTTVIGIWYNPKTKQYYTPTYLLNHAKRFNWKVDSPKSAPKLLPHDGDVPLLYDENIDEISD